MILNIEHLNKYMLALKNSHPRDKNIKFYEKTHHYTVDDKGGYTSVTSVLKKLFEPFNSDSVIDKMMNGNNWENSQYFGMTKQEIKNKWKKDGIEAANAGTKLHADIEKFYNQEEYLNDSEEFKYFMKFHEENKELKPYRTEWMVWDEDSKLSGSIDMVFEKEDGTLMIYDWKRSKNITKNSRFETYSKHKDLQHIPDLNYWHYSLQLNLYKYIIETKYGKKVSELKLVCLHPIHSNYIIYDVPELQEEIQYIL